MEPRTLVEEFLGGKWETRDVYDGDVYCVQAKVNGEEKPFSLEVAISNTVRSTQPDGVERKLNEADWEEISKKKIKQEVGNRLLVDKSTTDIIHLCIDYREVPSLLLPEAL